MIVDTEVRAFWHTDMVISAGSVPQISPEDLKADRLLAELTGEEGQQLATDKEEKKGELGNFWGNDRNRTGSAEVW